jgi:RNA polymerase sigma-70 factor (ECF subfamily)
MILDTNSLIRECKDKNVISFRTLVDNYSEFAFALAFRILNDEDEAKDVVQESFIAVWNKIDSFKPDKNFSSWLYRIIVNKCNDSFRRKRRNALVYPDAFGWNLKDIFSESNPDKNLDNEETGKLIRLLTAKLSPRQKIIFILSEVQGLNHDDISEITGIGKDSIKSNLNHARRNIGKMIEKYL